MSSNNLTKIEQELLNKLNLKAAVILQIEETLAAKKIPINSEALYALETEELIAFLENWSDEKQAELRGQINE